MQRQIMRFRSRLNHIREKSPDTTLYSCFISQIYQIKKNSNCLFIYVGLSAYRGYFNLLKSIFVKDFTPLCQEHTSITSCTNMNSHKYIYVSSTDCYKGRWDFQNYLIILSKTVVWIYRFVNFGAWNSLFKIWVQTLTVMYSFQLTVNMTFLNH